MTSQTDPVALVDWDQRAMSLAPPSGLLVDGE
jgi:hypothetical protein